MYTTPYLQFKAKKIRPLRIMPTKFNGIGNRSLLTNDAKTFAR